jgi:hypothetical protein
MRLLYTLPSNLIYQLSLSGVRGSNSLDEAEMRDAGFEPCPEDKGEKEGPMKGF